MQLKDVPLILLRQRADLLRGLMLVLVFRPAAFVCPEPLIWGLSYACALVVVLQASGRRMAQDYRCAFGVTRGAAFRMAIRTHARRFHEFALQQKAIIGWHKAFGFPVQLEADDEARRIVDGDGSFMLAMAHFERTDAYSTLVHPEVFHGRPIYAVAFKLPNFVLLPHFWRMSLQLRQLLRVSLRARPKGLEFVYLGGATEKLVEKLRTERSIVSVNIDAHWPRGKNSSLSRPFAGASQRTYSTGSAKIARLAGAPLLLGLPVMSDDGRSVRMRVFGPFRSTAPSAEQQDVDVTNQVLDVIEREVGERPCEYLLDIGGERRWNRREHEWFDAPRSAAPASLPVESG